MIVGIGVDAVSHEEVTDLKWESDLDFQARYFATEELKLYQKDKRLRFLAGRLAVKEAVVKCLGTGMQDGMALKDIKVLQDALGQPYIELTGEVKELAEEKSIAHWNASITHSAKMSIAFVVAESI